jgi:hypothetical protein
MTLEYESTKITPGFEQTKEATMLLRGHWLLLARAIWIILVILTLVIFYGYLPAYFAQLQTVCTSALCTFQQLTPDRVQSIRLLNQFTGTYAIYTVVLTVAAASVWFITGIVLFYRKSDERMVLLISLLLVLQGTADLTNLLQYIQLAWTLPALCLNFLSFALLFLVFSLFPDGHFMPLWTRWLMLLFLIVDIPSHFFPNLPFNTHTWPYVASEALWSGLFISIALCQVYRYRYMSSTLQRQQTKWVVFGISATMLTGFALNVFTWVYPLFSQVSPLYNLAIVTIWFCQTLFIPLSIGIAIVRPQWWDIDRLINRTLVYVTLTGTMALLYIGSIIGLQSLLGRITGEASQSSLAIIGAALAIAALFQPLRGSIQKFIDSRFYRHKYDATRMLATFSATLRDEVDLFQLRKQLVNVVKETMEPTSVSLWLRSSEGDRHDVLPEESSGEHSL